MSRRVHYELELDECLSQPLCENQAVREAIAHIDRECEMSPYDEEVTCKRCLKALHAEPLAWMAKAA